MLENQINPKAHEELVNRQEFKQERKKGRVRSIIGLIVIAAFGGLMFSGNITSDATGVILLLIMAIFIYASIRMFLSSHQKLNLCDFGVVTKVHRHETVDEVGGMEEYQARYSYTVSTNDGDYTSCTSRLDVVGQEFRVGDEVIIWRSGTMSPTIIKRK